MITGKKLSSFFKLLADALDCLTGTYETGENGPVGVMNASEEKTVVSETLPKDDRHNPPPSPS